MTWLRTPLNRRRTPPINDAVVALFVELETTPRDDPTFKERDYALHKALGLNSEWFCNVCSVMDRNETFHHSPDSFQGLAWAKVHAVRLRLLEAARERGLLPAAEAERV